MTVHIDKDTNAERWNSICGSIVENNGITTSTKIDLLVDYAAGKERDWCPECVNHPDLPLLLLALVDL